MNKQLINKYKPEFDHWLNGGKILYKHITSSAWWNDEPWNYSPDYVTAIIIKDEYVEFRKALAEGKTVEYMRTTIPERWCKVDINYSFNSCHLHLLRIKPEEPKITKFKVGDFVRYIHHSPNTLALQIDNINCDRYYFVNSSMSCLKHELIPWTPVKGEWCWFFNKDRIPTISQFVEFHKDVNKYFATYTNTQKSLGAYYTSCEPFVGELSSMLKEQ